MSIRSRTGWSTRLLLALLLLTGGAAPALDATLSGSVAVDHRLTLEPSGRIAEPGVLGLDSTNLELAQKVVVDVSEGVSFTVKACLGCHGLEVDQGFAELHVNDWLNLRVGRVNVAFGEFNARHDPANFTAPSKPLPYAMGDMLRYRPREFNMGVVPTPYSDNGVELFGVLPPLGGVQVDYAVYAVRGLAGENDLDFIASRAYPDTNRTPSLGARVVASSGEVSLGASLAGGFYDRADRLGYLMGGLESYARLGRWVLRAELVARRTELDPDAQGYAYSLEDAYFLKLGWYGQLDYALGPALTLLYRADGLRRLGMPLPGSSLEGTAAGIVRHTLAGAWMLGRGLSAKLGYERWLFQGTPYPPAHVLRAGLVFGY